MFFAGLEKIHYKHCCKQALALQECRGGPNQAPWAGLVGLTSAPCAVQPGLRAASPQHQLQRSIYFFLEILLGCFKARDGRLLLQEVRPGLHRKSAFTGACGSSLGVV